MACVVLCPTCHEEYTVERDAILRGTWRLGCPRCTTKPPDPESPSEPTGCPTDG